MKKRLAFFSSVVLGIIAVTFVNVASIWNIHSPKVPAELRKVNP